MEQKINGLKSGSSIWNRIPSAPSIPANHQAFGYDETGRGELIMQSHPEKVYAGTSKDSVGPGHYTIKEGLAPKGFTWHKSKSKRTLIHKDNTGPDLGPGSYEGGLFTVGPLYKFKASAAFLSKEKKFPGPVRPDPGPGYYNPSSPSYRPREYPKKLQNFGSSTRRFKRKLNESDLGPGCYSIENEKRSSYSKVPFSSSNSRFKYRSSLTPGPGYYDDSLNTSINGKGGKVKNVIVSKEKRFTEQNKALTPGPGQYADVKRTGLKNKHPSAVFVSKSSRGLSVPAQIPAPGSYEIKSTIGNNSKKGKSIHPLHNSKSKSDSNIGFYSKVVRFSQINSGESQIPGPGSYETIPKSSSKGPILGKESRFKATQDQIPGPGMYLEETDWNKRSFNILFTELF